MGTLWQDVRYGGRMLVRNPGFTVIVVVILAIGIGATTAMLGIMDGVLLRPPPYEGPDSLVYLYAANKDTGSRRDNTSYPNVMDWKNQSTVFEQVAGECNWGPATAVIGERRERVWGRLVSREFFPMLRVRPALGRTFLPKDDQPDAERVVVLSHGSWRDWFGSDPAAIGKTMTLNKQIYTVIGVLPSDFRHVTFMEHFVWLPLSYIWPEAANRGNVCMHGMGRLKPGVGLVQAQEQMNIIGRRLEQEYPESNAGIGVSVIPLKEEYQRRMGEHRRVFFIAQGVVTFVLLIACLHVANLLLIRSVLREREITIRAALGAERLRLVRQLLTESVLLAAVGGALGLLLAHWLMGIVSALRAGPTSWYVAARIGDLIPRLVELRMDGRTLVYAAAVTLSACALFAVLPALGASRIDLGRSLSVGRTPGRGPRFHRVRSFLVVSDIALAFVLLVGAGLMVNSYLRILSIEPGYETKNVLNVHILLEEPSYSQPERQLAFFQDVLSRAKELPGVRLASVTSHEPVWGPCSVPPWEIEGFAAAEYYARFPKSKAFASDKDHISLPRSQIFPDYFRVLQIPLLRGRYFTEDDTATSSPVAIINESMVRRFWPNKDPIGRYITEPGPTGGIARQIVGVVADVRHFGAGEPGDPEVYVPYLQTGGNSDMCLLVRADSDPTGLTAALRRVVLSVDAGATISSISLMESDIADFFRPQRFSMLALGVFAVVALTLAAVGVYGVTAYAVSQRTQEIGIRMALGAKGRDVLKEVVGQGVKLTLVGVAVGLVGAYGLTRVITGLLYDLSPTDPLTLACAALFLAGVALLACYLPARRAARVDPMVALRYE